MSERIMTSEQMARYMREGGCPNCGGPSVDCDDGYEGFTGAGNVAGVYESMNCMDCGCTWEEQYHIARILVSDSEVEPAEPAVSVESFED